MLEVKSLQTNYVHGKMKTHAEIKDELLRLIMESPSHSLKDETEIVSNTDMNFKDTMRPWMPLFFENIKPYMEEFTKTFMHKGWSIHDTWFFRYKRGEYSQWHVHQHCSWTNVYFVNLPDPKMKTTLLDVKTGKDVQVAEVEEGDIISFPSTIIHCSKVNQHEEEKVVVAFNSDIYDTLVHHKYPVETEQKKVFSEYGNYGENNPPLGETDVYD